MPTAKAGPWLDQAIAKGLLTNSSGVQSSALAAAATGGAGVALDVIPDGIDEATWQSIVVGYAEPRGWKVAHCRKRLVKKGKKQWWETTMPAGWFDLVLARDVVIYAELKVLPNVRTPEQEEWAEIMANAGQRVALWYPEDWNAVQGVLR